jgi:hypothetical protein
MIFQNPETWLDAFEDDTRQVLKEIALGRKDCGRPLAAEVARQKAREVLTKHGIGWAEVRKS